MATKRSLSEALNQAAGNTTTKTNSNEELKKNETKAKNSTVLIGGHFDPAIRRQLKLIEAETGNNLQGLLKEAINDLFLKYKKSPIA